MLRFNFFVGASPYDPVEAGSFSAPPYEPMIIRWTWKVQFFYLSIVWSDKPKRKTR